MIADCNQCTKDGNKAASHENRRRQLNSIGKILKPKIQSQNRNRSKRDKQTSASKMKFLDNDRLIW